MKKRLMHLVSAASLITISVYPLLHIAQTIQYKTVCSGTTSALY